MVDWVETDKNDYVARAVRHANNLAGLPRFVNPFYNGCWHLHSDTHRCLHNISKLA